MMILWTLQNWANTWPLLISTMSTKVLLLFLFHLLMFIMCWVIIIIIDWCRKNKRRTIWGPQLWWAWNRICLLWYLIVLSDLRMFLHEFRMCLVIIIIDSLSEDEEESDDTDISNLRINGIIVLSDLRMFLHMFSMCPVIIIDWCRRWRIWWVRIYHQWYCCSFWFYSFNNVSSWLVQFDHVPV